MGERRGGGVKITVVSAGIVSDRRPHGEAIIAHNILSRLGRRGHDVVAYCTEADGSLDGVDLRTISAHAPGAALSRLAFARRVAKAARGDRPDILHMLLPLTTDQGYTLVDGAPLVVGPLMLPWPAGDGGASPRNRALSAAMKAALGRYEARLHSRTLERAARLLVTCEPARAALPQTLHGKCDVVPYGVDTTRFVPTPMPADPIILFYSVLLPRKGIFTLLRALPMVRSRVPKVRLVIAGDDPRNLMPQIMDEASALGVADAIEPAGAVPHAKAPELFARARVFCQPSDGEPFGMTILEAMASGRPVVATHAGGIPGFVRDGVNGRLVSPKDERLLADALIRTLERTAEAETIGAVNRKAAVARFDWERVVDGIEASYGAAISKEVPDVRVAS